jgi:DNA-binding response OmpR family regulator
MACEQLVILAIDYTIILSLVNKYFMINRYNFLCISSDCEFLKNLKRSTPPHIKLKAYRDPACALKEFSPQDYHGIIVEQTLEHGVGVQIVERIRKRHIDLPIVLVCESDNIRSSINAWSIGADVVMAKPIEPHLLFAQCQALANRQARLEGEYSYLGDATLHARNYLLVRDGQHVDLARRELAILKLLLRYRGHTVQREQLHNQTQKYDRACTDNVLDVHISKLRKKFNQIGLSRCSIKTVYGVGYKLEG